MQETLEDLGAGDVPTLVVFNKIDMLQDRSILPTLSEKYPNSVFISAVRGINILGLKDAVAQMLQKEFFVEEVVLPDSKQKVIAQLYDVGEVLERSYEEGKVKMKIRIHRRFVNLRCEDFLFHLNAFTKVDEKSDFDTRGLKIIQKLIIMGTIYCSVCFQFNNNTSFNK